jgi:hypothetical protein
VLGNGNTVNNGDIQGAAGSTVTVGDGNAISEGNTSAGGHVLNSSTLTHSSSTMDTSSAHDSSVHDSPIHDTPLHDNSIHETTHTDTGLDAHLGL